MRTMAIAVFINVIGRNGLAPGSTTLEFRVSDIDTGVNNIDVDTVTTFRVIEILRESAEAEFVTVADTGQTLTCGVNFTESYGIQQKNLPKASPSGY